MKFIKPVALVETGAFTRATTGTYVDSAGVIQTAAINVVRFSYEPEPRILVEDPATNLCLYSEVFSNAAWAKTANVTVIPNVINAPDGTLTADKLTSNTLTAGNHYCVQTLSTTQNVILNFSIFIKPDEVLYAVVEIVSSSNSSVLCFINLITGGTTASFTGTGSGYTANATAYNSGWWRVSIAGIPTVVAGTNIQVRVIHAQSMLISNYSSTAIDDGFYIWGAQLTTDALTVSYIPTIAAAVTRAADVNAMKLYSSIPEPDTGETLWSAATTYTVGQRAVLASTHHIYECAIGNINAIPSANLTGTSPKWFDVSATNHWLMFDEVWGTQSIKTDTLLISLKPGVLVDSIAFLNIIADSISVVAVRQGQTVLYTRNITMATTVYRSDYFLTDLPTMENLNITINIKRAGGNGVCIGKLIIGCVFDLGLTQYGVKAGITDYSTKNVDVFGQTTLVKRRYSKRLTANIIVDNTRVDTVFNTLALYRSTPLVWIGADNYYTMMIVYGYYQSFDIDVQYFLESYCTLELTGMT